MGMVGCLALAANLSVAALLFGYRRSDSQALSVWLCTRNDALINLAVIAAGAGAWLSGGHWPDIVVAVIVAALALSAALRITRQARAEMRATTIAPAE
jgi:Co/Zn/Cd efflux system component